MKRTIANAIVQGTIGGLLVVAVGGLVYAAYERPWPIGAGLLGMGLFMGVFWWALRESTR